MKSLYEHYQSLKKSYYDINITADDLFLSPKSKQKCNRFIRDHFIRGNKEGVFAITDSYKRTYLSSGKQQHTVSLYLLGLLLSPAFELPIKKTLQEFFVLDEWFKFKYTWFLTCLYHDVTSCVEKSKQFKYEAEDILRSKLFEQDTEGKKLLRFSKASYYNYMLYRKNSGYNEHGIIAGIELFDRLCNVFIRNTAGHNWECEPVYYKNNLAWRREHLPHFAYIADAICCHNIWLAPKKNKALCQKYQDHSLDELIINQQSDKLSLQEYPLQFMLCLLDTMEPIKRFKGLAPDEILKNIYLDFSGEGLTLGWTPLIKEQPQFFDWLRPIATIGEWMQISGASCVHRDNLCSITLSWNNEQTKRGK